MMYFRDSDPRGGCGRESIHASLSWAGFQPDTDEETLGRFIPRGLRLQRLHRPESFLELLDKVRVTSTMENLGDERAFRLHVIDGEIDRQLDQVGNPRGVRR